MNLLARSALLKPHVQRIPEGVADEVEGDHGQHGVLRLIAPADGGLCGLPDARERRAAGPGRSGALANDLEPFLNQGIILQTLRESWVWRAGQDRVRDLWREGQRTDRWRDSRWRCAGPRRRDPPSPSPPRPNLVVCATRLTTSNCRPSGATARRLSWLLARLRTQATARGGALLAWPRFSQVLAHGPRA